jgi:hypothetical protein
MYPLIMVLSWLMYKYLELPSIEAGKWLINYVADRRRLRSAGEPETVGVCG